MTEHKYKFPEIDMSAIVEAMRKINDRPPLIDTFTKISLEAGSFTPSALIAQQATIYNFTEAIHSIKKAGDTALSYRTQELANAFKNVDLSIQHMLPIYLKSVTNAIDTINKANNIYMTEMLSGTAFNDYVHERIVEEAGIVEQELDMEVSYNVFSMDFIAGHLLPGISMLYSGMNLDPTDYASFVWFLVTGVFPFVYEARKRVDES